MSARRSSWPLVGPGVLIDAVTAPMMVALLKEGRKQAAHDRWPLSDEIIDALKQLDAFAATNRPAPPPVDDPDEASGEWMSTAQAAALLQLSPRQVRRMATERRVLRFKKVGTRLLIDADDALTEADARSEWGTSPGRPPDAA